MTSPTSALAELVSPCEGYAQWAATYNEDPNPVVALQRRMLRAILPDAHRKTVVDLGCGTGEVLSLWREQSPVRLIGIDVSPEMLQRAAGSAHSLIAADCCALPLADGTADLISCCLTLGYLPDLESFVTEVARIISSRGRVLISDLHPESAVRFGWRRGFTNRGETVNIKAHAYPISDVVRAFGYHGFQSELLLEVPFDNPELAVFAAAGRSQQFERFRDYPALYFLQLQRSDAPSAAGGPIVLSGARFALGATEAARGDLTITQRAISQVGIRSGDEIASLDLSGYLLLPGMINAHDHLEFALFPRLGRGRYQNSREWAEDIYRPEESPIREQLRVPKWVRLWWGGIRNLLCGVTTVCHHDPYEQEVFTEDFPVRVVQDVAWAHSLAFDAEVAAKSRESGFDVPFVIHAAEGIDHESSREVDRLFELGILNERSVIVHGNGLDADGLELLTKCGAALVWCPSSNVFLFAQTRSPDEIASLALTALGSDSPLTATGDLLDEVRFAGTLGASSEMLFQLVTRAANRLLRLKQGEGRICPGAVADLIAVRDRGASPADTVSGLSYRDIELVIKSGRVHLVSDAVKAGLPKAFSVGLELLRVDGVRRWVRAPIRELLELSREALGPETTMCGRSLAQ